MPVLVMAVYAWRAVEPDHLGVAKQRVNRLPSTHRSVGAVWGVGLPPAARAIQPLRYRCGTVATSARCDDTGEFIDAAFDDSGVAGW
jgi:hypothetical protein